MNYLQLNPTAYPGVQSTTILNSDKSKEFKELQIVGAVISGLPAATDAYIDIYVGYKAPRNRRRVMTKGSTTAGLRVVRIEQANSYIIESLNFSGYLIGDFGTNPNVTFASALAGAAAIVVPNFNFQSIMEPDYYASDNITTALLNRGSVTGRIEHVMMSVNAPDAVQPVTFTVKEANDGIGTGIQNVSLMNSPNNVLDINNSIPTDSGGLYLASFVRTKPYIQAVLQGGVGSPGFRYFVTFFDTPTVI